MMEWCPFAEIQLGPARKSGYSAFLPGAKRGEVKHSAEGGWVGLYSVLFDLDRRSSWHFTIGEHIEQHYPVSAHTWHAGDIGDDQGVRANIELVGIEHLGVAGTPLTERQTYLTTKLTRWLMETQGYSQATRWTQNAPGGVWLLTEHNQVSDDPTSCPSGRIPWAYILNQLQEARMKYTDEVLDGVIAELLAATGQALGIGRALATSYADHIQNHSLPGVQGDPMDEIAQVVAEVDEIQEILGKFSEALADAA